MVVKFFRTTIVCAVFVAAGCGGSPQPQVPHGEEGEKAAYERGYRYGMTWQAARNIEALQAKEAELARLRSQLESERVEFRARAGAAQGLHVCGLELRRMREHAADLEASLDLARRALYIPVGNDSASGGANRSNTGSGVGSSPAPSNDGEQEPNDQPCCKVCRKGKACGDSCISRRYECHKGPGCACDG